MILSLYIDVDCDLGESSRRGVDTARGPSAQQIASTLPDGPNDRR
jgi:hypothetical protein